MPRRGEGRRPALAALARALGILPSYVAADGRTVRRTTDATRVALAAAMGCDAATEVAAARALRALEEARDASPLPPVRVVRAREVRRGLVVPARVAGGGPVRWELALVAEDGALREASGATRPRGGRAALRLPGAVPLGYHRLLVRLGDGREAEQRLIVVPQRCPATAELLGRRRAFGLCANLYMLTSARSWGVGDLTDLRGLVALAGEAGAAFVGVNPLHALRARGADVSPYAPVSRLFRNPLYLDPEAVPELAESRRARALLAAPELAAELAALRAASLVPYDGVSALKEKVLHALHETFVERHRDRDDERGRAYARWRGEQGEALDDFATFCALERAYGPGFRAWPAAFRDPRSAAVAAFRAAHAEEVDFHRWLQFELDRQLGQVVEAARTGGVGLGVYQDLAVGSSGDGSDRWSFPELFLDGASLGAPPDAYAAAGQNWGLPPLHPRRLRADGYHYWIALVRAGLRHAGALRIDHVMGLFRQYWVPAGRPARDGAYVRFPAEDLLGILALESERAGAVVIGEDLGTVPPQVPRLLARHGILSSAVLYFERTRDGGFKPSARWSPRALVTANTHDLPPVASFWTGRDLELRRAAGLLPDDRALRRARAERARDRRALLARLAAERVIARGARPDGAALRAAVHAFLCRTPAPLVGVWVDDLTGETAPANLPGAPPDRFPSWRRRYRLPLEALATDPDARTALAGAASRAGRGRR